MAWSTVVQVHVLVDWSDCWRYLAGIFSYEVSNYRESASGYEILSLARFRLVQPGKKLGFVIIFVSLSNMTSTAPLSVVLTLFSKGKEGKRGRCGGHIWKGYKDYFIFIFLTKSSNDGNLTKWTTWVLYIVSKNDHMLKMIFLNESSQCLVGL